MRLAGPTPLLLTFVSTLAMAQPAGPVVPAEARTEAVRVEGDGYCYVGPHPVDTTAAAGPSWDDNAGQHLHFYAPLDLRLFRREGSCYRFIGDPTDFGYQGPTWGFWDAHPVPVALGGGWCHHVGGHQHPYRPPSSYYAAQGDFALWQGAVDPSVALYGPYWAAFYARDYGRHYAEGRYHGTAPPLTVPWGPPPHLPRGPRPEASAAPGGTDEPAGRPLPGWSAMPGFSGPPRPARSWAPPRQSPPAPGYAPGPGPASTVPERLAPRRSEGGPGPSAGPSRGSGFGGVRIYRPR